MKYEAVVMGMSSGGMNVMKTVFPLLPAGFTLPIIIVQHLSPQSDSTWIEIIDKMCALPVTEAEEKEQILPGKIYVAPPNYHLLIEKNKSFSLTIDERINYARPSIDVLFESAADAYREKLIGIICSGSNHDGSMGLKKIKDNGGLAIAQDPLSAESYYMPETAVEKANPQHILALKEIVELLIYLDTKTIN